MRQALGRTIEVNDWSFHRQHALTQNACGGGEPLEEVIGSWLKFLLRNTNIHTICHVGGHEGELVGKIAANLNVSFKTKMISSSTAAKPSWNLCSKTKYTCLLHGPPTRFMREKGLLPHMHCPLTELIAIFAPDWSRRETLSPQARNPGPALKVKEEEKLYFPQKFEWLEHDWRYVEVPKNLLEGTGLVILHPASGFGSPRRNKGRKRRTWVRKGGGGHGPGQQNGLKGPPSQYPFPPPERAVGNRGSHTDRAQALPSKGASRNAARSSAKHPAPNHWKDEATHERSCDHHPIEGRQPTSSKAAVSQDEPPMREHRSTMSATQLSLCRASAEIGNSSVGKSHVHPLRAPAIPPCIGCLATPPRTYRPSQDGLKRKCASLDGLIRDEEVFAPLLPKSLLNIPTGMDRRDFSPLIPPRRLPFPGPERRLDEAGADSEERYRNDTAHICRMRGRLCASERSWTHTITSSLDKMKENSHPLLEIVLNSFIEEDGRIRGVGRSLDPRERILQKGPGFIDGPSTCFKTVLWKWNGQGEDKRQKRKRDGFPNQESGGGWRWFFGSNG